MGLVGLLWFLASIVSLAGFVWLCVVAFRRHVGWGLAVVFLSPIAAIVFAVKHWPDSKKPFLVYAGSTAACLALAVMTFSALGGFQMMGMAHRMSQGEEISDEEAAAFLEAQIERMEHSGMLSAEDDASEAREPVAEIRPQRIAATTPRAALDGPVRTREIATGSPSLASARRTADPGTTTLPSGEPVPSGYKLVPVGDADQYVGRTIRIVGKDGRQSKGRLADARSNYLLVERHLTAGTVSFELKTSEVDSLLVAYR